MGPLTTLGCIHKVNKCPQDKWELQDGSLGFPLHLVLHLSILDFFPSVYGYLEENTKWKSYMNLNSTPGFYLLVIFCINSIIPLLYILNTSFFSLYNFSSKHLSKIKRHLNACLSRVFYLCFLKAIYSCIHVWDQRTSLMSSSQPNNRLF